MGRYLIRRVLFMVLVLFIVSVLTFVIFLKLPAGDPARLVAGKAATEQTIEDARIALGLDLPWYSQYGRFAKGLLPIPGWWLNEQVYFNWGNNVPVWEEVKTRFPWTLALTVGGAVLWLLIGIPLGIVSAVRRGHWQDRAGMLFALVGVSVPTFWLGLVMLYIFWYKLGWFPGSNITPGQSIWDAVLEGKFILPWITIAVTSAAFYTRMVRGNMIETSSEDYIRTARSKGLSEGKVVYKHTLRASLTPVVTMLGLDIGFMLGGAVITETVFALPGLGKYAIDSIYQNNMPGTMAVTIISAIFIVVANLIVDVVYAFLDPRVRYE